MVAVALILTLGLVFLVALVAANFYIPTGSSGTIRGGFWDWWDNLWAPQSSCNYDGVCAPGVEDCGTCPGDCPCPNGQTCQNRHCVQGTTASSPSGGGGGQNLPTCGTLGGYDSGSFYSCRQVSYCSTGETNLGRSSDCQACCIPSSAGGGGGGYGVAGGGGGTTSNDCCLCTDIFGQSNCISRDLCWWPTWCSGDCSSCSGSTTNPAPQQSCSSNCINEGYIGGRCRLGTSGTTCDSYGETINNYPGLCSSNQNCCCDIATTQTQSATQSTYNCISACNYQGYSSGTCTGGYVCPSNFPVYLGNSQCANNQNCCCSSGQTQAPTTTTTFISIADCSVNCYKSGFLNGYCRSGNSCYNREIKIVPGGCSGYNSCCCSGVIPTTQTSTPTSTYNFYCCAYSGGNFCAYVNNCVSYGYISTVSGPYSTRSNCLSYCGSSTQSPTPTSTPTSRYKVYCCLFPDGSRGCGLFGRDICETYGYTTVSGPFNDDTNGINQCYASCK